MRVAPNRSNCLKRPGGSCGKRGCQLVCELEGHAGGQRHGLVRKSYSEPVRAIFAVFFALFALTALYGAAISFDPPAAAARLAYFAIGIILYFAVRSMPGTWLPVLPAAGFVLAAYFLLSNDWLLRLGKLPELDPLLRLLAQGPSVFPTLPVNTNTIGGILAMFMPMQAIAAARARGSARTAAAATLVVSGIALLLTLSRGALVALLSATLCAAMCALLRRAPESLRAQLNRSMPLAAAFGTALMLCGGIGLAAIGTRSELADVDLLLRDYWLTGIGFDGFALAYSTYALLTHVPYLQHAHNLYANIWLSQGLLGLAAFVGMVFAAWVVALRARLDGAGHWPLGGFLGLVVVLTHGMIDDPFHGDVIFLPALFVPFALLLRSAAPPPPIATRLRAVARASARVFGGLAALAAVAWLFSGARSGAYASVGALRQAQIELGVYRNGMNERWGLQDAARLSLRGPMNEPMSYYAQALALNPANSSASRRLGQIELTFGLYDSAFKHLAAAYQGDVSNHTTRLLAGEAFAVAGDDAQRLEMAAEAWRGVPDARSRLSGRLAWYASFIQDNIRASRMEAALALTIR